MTELQVERPQDVYLQGLLKQWERGSDRAYPWLDKLRQTAAEQVLQSRLPNKKDEDWRFTDLSELTQLNFQVAQAEVVADIDDLIVPEAAHSRLVFVNGIYAPSLSDTSGIPSEVYVGNLAKLSDTQKEKIVKYFAQQPGADSVFTALNTSAVKDIAVVWASANATIAAPIHLLFLSVATEAPILSQPRTLIIAERGARVQLLEQYSARSAQPYLTNGVTEIWVEENAQLEHIRVQQESGESFHIGRSAIAQARDSRYTCTEIHFGGKLSRHNLEVYQTGEQTETRLNGLAMVKERQLADTHSLISLSKPYGTTDQLHKCIVDGSAHTVFNGKVLVPKAAQLTNAAQLNRNLLLSPKARVDTKPELQITADNVKCSHGATVSQLEPDELFYLRSRGLTDTDARYLLIDAFAAEILERIPVESVRTQLSQLVARRTQA